MNFKKIILFSGLALTSFSLSAVEVLEAKLDATAENIIVKVKHGGGCGKHDYKLVMHGCAESMPVQCQATIEHTTNDFCEALLVREAKFNIKQYGLNTSYYKDAKITIKGDAGSVAKVNLIKAATPATTSSKIRCMTHTGSILEIQGNLINLTTTENENSEFTVIGKDVRFLESMPGIFQTVYKLDDGRSIQTDFREGSKEGTGKFIRIDGSRSPEFKCIAK